MCFSASAQSVRNCCNTPKNRRTITGRTRQNRIDVRTAMPNTPMEELASADSSFLMYAPNCAGTAQSGGINVAGKKPEPLTAADINVKLSTTDTAGNERFIRDVLHPPFYAQRAYSDA